MLSEHRDMAAAQAFFRSAKAATGITPERVTTDGHGSYPRAIRSTLGRRVVHRTSAYRNNGLEQDHRGVKGRIRCRRGFRSIGSPSASVEAMTNSETPSALVPATTSTSLPAAVALCTSAVPQLRSPSSKQRGSGFAGTSRR
ncbi:DDE-type integrase/transposase/recombinase [Belnapia moabensis]|uniref:DDE-type integrase/transposase/recombinase n=1 Tax=Belnapia moabensis TaxID=365533 RepID=UPI0038CD18AF